MSLTRSGASVKLTNHSQVIFAVSPYLEFKAGQLAPPDTMMFTYEYTSVLRSICIILFL